MTMARFPMGEYTADGGRPGWLTFIREVNGVRPGTFGAVENQPDTPRRGYTTEEYHGARVIFGPHRDEGVRVMADNDEVRAAFYVAAARMKVHIASAEGVVVVIGLTESDRDNDYVSFDDGYRPSATQVLHMITVTHPVLDGAGTEVWSAVDWAEQVFQATNDPSSKLPPIQDHIRRELRRMPSIRSLGVGDTVTVLDQTWACQPTGWIRVSPLVDIKCAECGRPAYYLGELAIAHHYEDEPNATHTAVIPQEVSGE